MKTKLVCLMILFTQILASAEETPAEAAGAITVPLIEGTAEGVTVQTGGEVAETTINGSEQATRAGVFAWLTTPEGMSAMAVTTTAVLITTYAIKKWNTSETRRRYRDAAAEADHLIVTRDEAPIAHAAPDSSLRQVSEVEINLMNAQKPPVPFSEPELAGLIIARSKRLEAEFR